MDKSDSDMDTLSKLAVSLNNTVIRLERYSNLPSSNIMGPRGVSDSITGIASLTKEIESIVDLYRTQQDSLAAEDLRLRERRAELDTASEKLKAGKEKLKKGVAICNSETEGARQARAFIEQKYKDKEAAVKDREAAVNDKEATVEENARTLRQEMNDFRNEKELEAKELNAILRAKKEELTVSQAFQREMMTAFASARGEDLNLAKQCLELQTKTTEYQLLAQAAESDKVKAEADGAERLKRAEELNRESDEMRREVESLLENARQEREATQHEREEARKEREEAHQEREKARQEREKAQKEREWAHQEMQSITRIMEEIGSRSGHNQDSIDKSRKEQQTSLREEARASMLCGDS